MTIPPSPKCSLFDLKAKDLACGTVHLKNISLMLSKYLEELLLMFPSISSWASPIISTQVLLFWCCLAFREVSYSHRAHCITLHFINLSTTLHWPHFSFCSAVQGLNQTEKKKTCLGNSHLDWGFDWTPAMPTALTSTLQICSRTRQGHCLQQISYTSCWSSDCQWSQSGLRGHLRNFVCNYVIKCHHLAVLREKLPLLCDWK